jgi:putative CocE/NonD family hydrolase
LKGVDNGVTRDTPKVQIYVMGRNEWRSESEWPLSRARVRPFYLRGDGHANSRFGTGTLSPQKPSSEPPDRFTYDPATPVPSLGGPLCCTGNPDAPAGAFDQSELEARQDVLVYTSPVLESGVEVTGPIEVVLYVSSSAPDTDFTAKLVDVYPDGTAYNVQEGIQRARYREGYERKVWMEPDGVYEVRVDLDVTSNFFGPGHRVRLEISSSNFPRFDRNLNTGGNNYDETEWEVARNTVYHTQEYPSHVLLPVIR